MPRRPRFCPDNIPVHDIQRGNNRQALFTSDKDIATYAHWLARLLDTLSRRIVRVLERRGLLIVDPEHPQLDFEPGSSLDHLQAAAIAYRIAIGPHAGRKAQTLYSVLTGPLILAWMEEYLGYTYYSPLSHCHMLPWPSRKIDSTRH